jgi:Protein of unknown function (DUF3108)
MMRSLCLLLASLVLVPVAIAAPPARLEIVYEVSRDGSTIADAVHRLAHGNGTYRLTETWQGRGWYALGGEVRRASRGMVVADGLRPLEYVDERRGRDTERASFDWKSATVTLEHKGSVKVIPLPANASDRLAMFYELAFDPQRAPRFPIDVIDGRGVSDQVYLVEGREHLTTPAGEFEVLKLVRHKENKERAELWLAVERSFIPVRIRLVAKDGTHLDQVATRISVD